VPSIDPSIVKAFTPTGVLRASINLGNAVLAGRDAAGNPSGTSVDLARAFAARLGVEVQLVPFDKAAASVDCVTQEKADIGFFAIDPKRGEGITFTPPYVLIEGAYLVRADSALTDNDQVDRPGTRIVVGGGSAYDLYLSREIKNAELIRTATSQAVVDTFLDQNIDVAAGVRQQLELDMQRRPGLRLLPGRFMVIRQAMGCPPSRGPAAAAALSEFVLEMCASGFVADALARHGIEGAAVARPGD
jgi:polar amino acid transport system substrate-binding protein